MTKHALASQSDWQSARARPLLYYSVRHEVTGGRQNRTRLVTCHDSGNCIRPLAESGCEPDYNQLSGGTVMFTQGSLKSHIALRAFLSSFSNRSRTDSWGFGIVEDPLLHHEMQQSVTLRQSSSCDTAWSPTWRWPHLAHVERAEPEQCSHSSGRYSRKSLWNDALLRAKWACCIY